LVEVGLDAELVAAAPLAVAEELAAAPVPEELVEAELAAELLAAAEVQVVGLGEE